MKQRKRKGAINLEPRLQITLEDPHLSECLSVSVCLCEIFLGIHSFTSSLGSVPGTQG